MKKGMFAKEFRQPELTLEKADLGDGSNVFVTRGIPLRLGGAFRILVVPPSLALTQ